MSIWVQQQVARPIHVRVPTVTRYMAQKHVDAFFEDGSLMLSSFKKFREHPDETKRDVDEGQTHIEETNPNAKGTMLMGAPPCFILCATSNQFDPEGVSWDTEAGFRILDPMNFAAVLAWHVPGFEAAIQGACDYTDGPDVDIQSDDEFVSPDKHPGGPEAWFEERKRLTEQRAVDGLFSKARDFLQEREYRFIWFGGEREDALFVKCPEARQFCRPLEQPPSA